jgi:hypothetical protein
MTTTGLASYRETGMLLVLALGQSVATEGRTYSDLGGYRGSSFDKERNAPTARDCAVPTQRQVATPHPRCSVRTSIIRNRESRAQISVRWPAVLTEDFRGFPQLLQESARIVCYIRPRSIFTCCSAREEWPVHISLSVCVCRSRFLWE